VELDLVVHQPAGVAEALHWEEAEPLGEVGVLTLQEHLVVGLLSASPDDHHGGATEESGVLLAA